MIEQAISILQQAGFDLTARELAEIIWLAVHIESEQSQHQPTRSEKDLPRTDQPQTVEIPEASLPQLPEPRAEVYLPSGVPSPAKPTESLEAIPIKVPAAVALRNSLALGRSLRPLMRKVASPTENILNEEATVCRIAEEKIWIPVLKPAPQKWLELALVVEQSSSIAIWKQTIAELQRLLKHHGAFRDVRTWELKVTETKVDLFPQSSTDTYSSTPHSPNVLIDPKGQRLILLVSDCISSVWRKRLIHPVLELWGRYGLITILQLLPERLWQRTALASEIPVQLHSLNPGVFNSQLIIETWDEDTTDEIENFVQEDGHKIQNSISVPVVTLEPHSLLTWSRVIAGLGNVGTVGFKFSFSVGPIEPTQTELTQSPPLKGGLGESTTQQSTEHKEPQLTPLALVNRFRATASPLARRLAGLMAAAPVSLPVVQLIQQTLLPQSGQIHVAEVFMSGLLLIPLENTNPTYIEYEFIEGVRELLLDSVPVSKTSAVLEKVSEFIAKRVGLSVRDFEARLLVPADQSQDTLEAKIRPFARLKAQVLRHLGGVYTQIAEELEGTEVKLLLAREVDYTRLRNLLTAGKWKEADRETLRVMLEATNQESRYWLESRDINQFPCDDLRTIDQLWVKYSKRRFGFSVQKQIYENLGGSVEYNQRVWEAFGDRVGWRRNIQGTEYWIDYTDFTFSLDAPLGHLPTWVELFRLDVWGQRKRKIRSFLSRVETCNLGDTATITFEFDVVTVNAQGQEINREKCQAPYYTEDLGYDITIEMVAIPGGKFMMGSPEGERSQREKPQHEVTVQPFFMGKYPVTQVQWRSVAALSRVNRDLNPDPSHFKGDNRPVEKVSWDDVVEFCARLSLRTGREYLLPSEAEWEYACRAGTTTPFHFGETITDNLANYYATNTFAKEAQGQNRRETTPVGAFPPNAFGLYDMHGNVWEWCADAWHENYQGAPTDGSAWIHDRDHPYWNTDISSIHSSLWKNIRMPKDNENKNHLRLLRGGSWRDSPAYCRSAKRYWDYPVVRNYNNGFRVVCSGAF